MIKKFSFADPHRADHLSEPDILLNSLTIWAKKYPYFSFPWFASLPLS
ncbi:Uncharacterized protein dnm_051650 [Desulfonema magnum]|uniref:Uncharacterized protein n=1 Tax=Desulfonema magnum TaxID=45655 RepID=A0A975BPM2_9BACT|nr:Uncharacterized protein dnm_051650 [Desulfonema magnum]